MGSSYVRYAVPTDPQFFPTPQQLVRAVTKLIRTSTLPPQCYLGEEVGKSSPPFICEVYDYESRAFSRVERTLHLEDWWGEVCRAPSEVWWHYSWFLDVNPELEWAVFKPWYYPLGRVPREEEIEHSLSYRLKFVLLPDHLALGYPAAVCTECSESLMDTEHHGGLLAHRECPSCGVARTRPNVVHDIEIDGGFEDNTNVAFRFAVMMDAGPYGCFDEESEFCGSVQEILSASFECAFVEYWAIE